MRFSLRSLRCSLTFQKSLPKLLQIMNYNKIASKRLLTNFPAKMAAQQELMAKGGNTQIRLHPLSSFCVRTRTFSFFYRN